MEVKKRVSAGWNRWRKISGVICVRRLPARVKRKAYSTAVRPAMVYGLETIAFTKKQAEEMKLAKVRMLRFAIGVTKKDKIRLEISIYVKVEPLEMKLREGRLQWYGHVTRGDQAYIRRRVIEMELPGKKKRGRPKRRFLDAVKENMKEVVAKKTDVKNRTLWKSIFRVANLD